MGSGMIHNLLRVGHSVIVFNRAREKAEALAQAGAILANSPAQASDGADAVMTMLADDHVTEERVFGKNGVASGLRDGAPHVSCGTLSREFMRRMAARHAEKNQACVSAPVFGRPDAAEAKRLVVVAAGARDAIERVRPLLDAIGRVTLVVASEPWQANAVKLCGNFMMFAFLGRSAKPSHACEGPAFHRSFSLMQSMNCSNHLST